MSDWQIFILRSISNYFQQPFDLGLVIQWHAKQFWKNLNDNKLTHASFYNILSWIS